MARGGQSQSNKTLKIAAKMVFGDRPILAARNFFDLKNPGRIGFFHLKTK